MCFEWEERYRREEAVRLNKEKTDELLKRCQEVVKAESAFGKPDNQPVKEQEEITA